MFRIFIGSSRESQTIAQSLGKYLAARGMRVLGWWEPGVVFTAGTNTFDSLMNFASASNCDGAVFIWFKDDKAWFRGEELSAPRDNVILEYGIFSSRLGKENAIIVQEEGAKICSDVFGLSLVRMSTAERQRIERCFDAEGEADAPAFAEIYNHFSEKHARRHHDHSVAKLIAVGTLYNKLRNGDYKRWASRTIYLGREGARNWMDYAVSNSPQGKADTIAEKASDMLRELRVKTVISFGPGDGQLDKELVMEISRGSKFLSYIPVDINAYLLHEVHSVMSGMSVHVPELIQGDIEDEIGPIMEHINRNTINPRIFIILGGTFANLEKSEAAFFNALNLNLRAGDYVLFDAYVKGTNYRDETDIIENLNEAAIRLFSSASAYKTGERIEDVISQFPDRFVVTKMNGGSVPSTSAYALSDERIAAQGCQKNIVFFRRYDFGRLKAWVQQRGFQVLSQKEVYDDRDFLGRGMFLLHKSG